MARTSTLSRFRPIADTTATLNALQSGDVDIVQAIAPTDIEAAKADTNLQSFDRGSACNVGHLAMNQSHKPFDNPKIRQAVGHAVNRQAIVDAFFGEAGVVVNNWVPPGTGFAVDQTLPEYDPAKAQALIAESGVTDLAFDFWYPSDVTRAYMPDPEGRVRGHPARPRGGRLQAEPQDGHLAPGLPRRRDPR